MTDLVDTLGEAAGTAVSAATRPFRWQLYGALLLAGLSAAGAGFWWHGAQVESVRDTAFKAGQAEVQKRWDTAVDEAKDKQAKSNDEATDQFVTEREVVRYVYRDRIEKVKTYVPNPDTDCPADAGFLQRYNAPATSPAGGAPDQ